MTAAAAPTATSSALASSSQREWAEIAGVAPTLAATATAYLDQIALSLRPGSVVVADTNLRLFCRYLLASHPDTRCFAAVGRPQVEGFKAWLGARMTPRGTAPSPNTRRQRLGMLRTFFVPHASRDRGARGWRFSQRTYVASMASASTPARSVRTTFFDRAATWPPVRGTGSAGHDPPKRR